LEGGIILLRIKTILISIQKIKRLESNKWIFSLAKEGITYRTTQINSHAFSEYPKNLSSTGAMI
jgi:hypothetical protein